VTSNDLITLFRASAEAHPSRSAVSTRDRVLPYCELDRLSDALAHELLSKGIGRHDHVAFYLDRGVQTFVTLLGILKAGAAYVPVDIRYPAARRDLMIQDSRAKLVVTEPGWSDRLASSEVEVTEIGVDSLASATPELPRLRGDDAACVLFTSGSTSRPKGVVLEHRNLVHFAGNPSLPMLNPQDRMGHVSNVSFDAFHFETWCAFRAGAEIAVLGTMPDLLAGDIHRELRQRRITTMLVPSMALNHIVREDRDAFASLRVLCTGGDVILPATCRDLIEGEFSGQLYNLYGPTEATTACTVYHVTAVGVEDDTVPIGTPLHGVDVRVLDGDRNPVPLGTVGELYVSGPGVARGYLDRPELTDQRFHTDPWSNGSRMYATGDMVRRRQDGVLEYLGRTDDQVKIRGFRVEPAEVERVLSRHPSIRETAVMAVGKGQDRHLIALVLPYDRLSIKQLRAYAAEQLPDFMVPSSFVRVSEIPVNDHGKRDLERLRTIAEEQLHRRDSRVPLQGETETYLAELWEELLSVEQIGATDDFFALGGNSLLAFRAQQRIGREMNVPLQPRDILKNSELRSLATLICERNESVSV
jgi:amino acid adenylation domain-containing protein